MPIVCDFEKFDIKTINISVADLIVPLYQRSDYLGNGCSHNLQHCNYIQHPTFLH